MRFGLWLLCYGCGMVTLLLPASWYLTAALASATTNQTPIDNLVTLAILYNVLASAASCAMGGLMLPRHLRRRRAAAAAVAPYGKPGRLAQQREEQRRVAARCGCCCIGLLVVLVGSVMRAGGFSSLIAQFAVDLLSPAPTNGAGAWHGPRLRWSVNFLEDMLVVQIPRILVVALPWLARFGRGRRGALLRSPFTMLIGLGLGASSGCIGRIQLLSQSHAILHGYLLSQAFPDLPTTYMPNSIGPVRKRTRHGVSDLLRNSNSSSTLRQVATASDIGCALLREPLVSSCGTNCFDMSWSDSCGPRDAPPLVMKTVRSGAGKPMTVPAHPATGPEEPPPRRVDCRIETRGRAAYGHMNGIAPQCSLRHEYPRPYWECTARFSHVLHEHKRHGHTPATCTLELPSEEVDIASSHHHVTLRWSERYGLHPWKPASVLWLPATIGEQRVSRTLAMHARERLLPQTALSRAQRWLYDGTVWAHPQLAAVIHSGDGEAGDVERGNSAAMAGRNSRDLAAAALYDAGLLRPPASATNDDPARATGVLLVEAKAPQQARFTFEEWRTGATATGDSDRDGLADLRHWTLGGASWILLDNSSEDRVRQSTEYLKAILRQRQPRTSVPSEKGSEKEGRDAAKQAAADADAAKQWLQHSTPPKDKHKSDLATGIERFLNKDVEAKREGVEVAPSEQEDGRRVLADGAQDNEHGQDEQAELLQSPTVVPGQRPTIVVVHLPLFTQWCGGTDNFATCADVVRIGALCAEQWVPLFDALGVDLVISHHGIGYQRGRLAGSRVTYVVAGGGLNHGQTQPVADRTSAASANAGRQGHQPGAVAVLNAPPAPTISLQKIEHEGDGGSGYSGGRGSKVEMVWSKSKQLHCYGLLTIEPPEIYEQEQTSADQPLEGNLLRPLELPQIRWIVFDANDRKIDDVRFVR